MKKVAQATRVSDSVSDLPMALLHRPDVESLPPHRDSRGVAETPEGIDVRVGLELREERAAAGDFEEVLFFAANGYGYGAVKLLRPLYERVVTVRYLMNHPERTDLFSAQADSDALRLIRRVAALDITVSPEDESAVAEAYEEVEASMLTNRCPKCKRGTGWTGKDVQAMANEVDSDGLGRMYTGGFFIPSWYIHTSRLPLDDRLQRSEAVFNERQRQYSDGALHYAHCLIVALLISCTGFFEWALNTAALVEDAQECWALP